MATTETATAEDFERMSQALLEFATRMYAQLGAEELEPVVAFLRKRAPVGAEESGKYEVGVMPVGVLHQEELGSAGKDLVAEVLQQTLARPEIRVVGYMSEAWVSGRDATAPAEAEDRKEVLLLDIQSVDSHAMQLCPLERKAGATVVTANKMTFATQDTPLHSRFRRLSAGLLN